LCISSVQISISFQSCKVLFETPCIDLHLLPLSVRELGNELTMVEPVFAVLCFCLPTCICCVVLLSTNLCLLCCTPSYQPVFAVLYFCLPTCVCCVVLLAANVYLLCCTPGYQPVFALLYSWQPTCICFVVLLATNLYSLCCTPGYQPVFALLYTWQLTCICFVVVLATYSPSGLLGNNRLLCVVIPLVERWYNFPKPVHVFSQIKLIGNDIQ
jgi:hypothetical protein